MLKKVLIAAAGLLISGVALADRDHHDRGRHHGHHKHYWKHDHHSKHHYYHAPRVVVAPRPVYVQPAPVYYYALPPAPVYYPAYPSSGVSIRFNFPL